MSKANVKVIHYNPNNNTILCVFNILNNKEGNKIKDEMLPWLIKKYDVYCVFHNGKLYEYPGLKILEYLLNHKSTYGLYIHTKGAGNPKRIQDKIRLFWKKQFTDYLDKYLSKLRNYNIVCPFTGKSHITWLNGFFVDQYAINKINRIQPHNDRYYFEGMFDGLDVSSYGIVDNDITTHEDTHRIWKYVRENV